MFLTLHDSPLFTIDARDQPEVFYSHLRGRRLNHGYSRGERHGLCKTAHAR
jgi:hypothetical protein